MSGQWEVVGKKKDRGSAKSALPVPSKDKKKPPLGVKVEEVLAQSQLKNLYAAGKNNKENQKPQEKNKPAENGVKKVQKKPEKPQEAKQKPPKSIESGVNAINAADFNGVFEKIKTLFPETPIVWLKELAQYLNTRLAVDVQDAVFSNKPDNYPLSVMPSTLKSIIEKAVKEAGPENAAVFFDICLTTMANDMNKDMSALGHKFFLQYLAATMPKLASNNVTKYVNLRTSYQNRQPIGLSILWALGQGGLHDLNVGLKVYQEIMYPVLDMKNYSRYVLKYLIALINKHRDASITKDQFLFILDIVFGNKKNASGDLTKELTDLTPILKAQVLRNSDKLYSFVDLFLKKLPQNSNKTYQNLLCEILISCMEKDANCLGTWGKIYTKNLPASAILLGYIKQNWKVVSKQINVKVFAELLKTYAVTNEELLLKKRKENGLVEAQAAIKEISAKMVSPKEKSSCACRRVPFVLLALILGSYVFYDVQQSGSWNKSQTSKALNKSGVYEYTNKALDRAKEGTQWVHNCIEEKFPGFTEKTIEFTNPYVELSRDLGIIVLNVANNCRKSLEAKIPIVLDVIDSYAPGLIDQTRDAAKKASVTACDYYSKAKDYLLTEVFIGKLSPEEMQKTVSALMEVACEKVTESYHWVHKRITTAIK